MLGIKVVVCKINGRKIENNKVKLVTFISKQKRKS
jgi:hypothetical protein